jgi:hypothetical protein
MEKTFVPLHFFLMLPSLAESDSVPGLRKAAVSCWLGQAIVME